MHFKRHLRFSFIIHKKAVGKDANLERFSKKFIMNRFHILWSSSWFIINFFSMCLYLSLYSLTLSTAKLAYNLNNIVSHAIVSKIFNFFKTKFTLFHSKTCFYLCTISSIMGKVVRIIFLSLAKCNEVHNLLRKLV